MESCWGRVTGLSFFAYPFWKKKYSSDIICKLLKKKNEEEFLTQNERHPINKEKR